MSDQPSPPPKPKPGSLRDRIAAFEKSASAAAPPAPAPAVRPKPAGFSSWKPKVPSPPSSPPASTTEHAASTSTRVGGMSASDAKESITKAGSLKERMAALQGKGAFGAPPTVAPKPALEKHKWKPPPVVHAPVDDDDHAAEASTAGIAAAVERTISPPVSVQSQENVEPLQVLAEGEESAAHAAAAEGDNEGEAAAVDPEEEERQRRAAIAARMARLGGARLGMAPPVFGKKPPVRRSTQEEIPPAEEPKSVEIASPPPAEEALVASPPTGAVAEDVRKAPEYFPSRKNSENASVLSSESTGSQPAKSPSSMPVPVVPRRAGPPRKKPVKPAAPPPEVPEEQAEETTPAPVTAEEAEKPVEEPVREPEPAIPRHEVAESPEHEESKAEIREEAPQPPVIPALPEVHHEVTPEPVAEVAEISGKEDLESATPSQVKSVESPGEETPVPPETSGFISPPPSLAQTNEDDLDDEYDDEDDEDSKMAESFIAPSIPPPPRAAPAEIAKPEETHVQSEISAPAPDVEEEDTEAAEEEARKKRVAERLAKMGGINPFAPPPQVKPSSEFAHSPPPAPAAFAASPPLAPTVVYEERHPVVTHSPLHEEAPPVHKEPFTESKVEEEELSDGK
ncbi:hypothetical protein BDZ97DRAFT_1065786 [Flammula alnicola]|nr:hypothetical protein BDZ97DRAFT_1065786 [Flammula alnicola]